MPFPIRALAASMAALLLPFPALSDSPPAGWQQHWTQCMPSMATNQGFALFNSLLAPANAATGIIERFDENLLSWQRRVTIWRQSCPGDSRFPAVFVRIQTIADDPGDGYLTIYAVELDLVQPAHVPMSTAPSAMAICSSIVDCGRAIVSQTSVTTAGNTFTFLLAHGEDDSFRHDQAFNFEWEGAVGTVAVPTAASEFTVFANDFE